jgi:hypothetical protein
MRIFDEEDVVYLLRTQVEKAGANQHGQGSTQG